MDANRADILKHMDMMTYWVAHGFFQTRCRIELLHELPLEGDVCLGFPKLTLSDLRDCYRRLHYNATLAMYHCLSMVGGDVQHMLEAHEKLMAENDVRDYEFSLDYMRADVPKALARVRKIFDFGHGGLCAATAILIL
jgi:hypothetical protein